MRKFDRSYAISAPQGWFSAAGMWLAIGIVAVTVAYTVLTQALAIIPVDAVGWLLQTRDSQAAILLLSAVRDQFGLWNIAISVAACLIAFTAASRSATYRRTWRILFRLSAIGLLACITTALWLISAVAESGASTSALRSMFPYPSADDRPDRTVIYGRPDGVALAADLYLPSHKLPGPNPVVVRIHGGGFVLGKRGANAHTQYLVDQGFTVMDIDYRLATPTFHTWDKAVGDVGCALTWVAIDGRSVGLDPDRVVTLGDSAGGNLAINAAYMIANGTMTPTCNSSADLPKVRAVIAHFPAVDMIHGATDTALGRLVGQYYVGGTPRQFPDRYRAIDSASHLSDRAPPTLIFQGNRDHLVLAGPVRAFARRAERVGVDIRYIEYPTLEHGWGNSNYPTQASGEIMVAWLRTRFGK